MPAYGRHHSSQILTINNKLLMIDCGEGTQEQISKYNIKPGKIDIVLISHLHGDHYLGLMGLISSMHLQGRTKPLQVFAPAGLKEILMIQLKYSGSVLRFKLDVHELETESKILIYETKNFIVESFPLNHRIPCCGFLIKEKEKVIRINKERLPENLSLTDIGRLKKGEDIIDDTGKVIFENSWLTLPPKKSRSFAYCSDTIYDEELLNYIKDVDLLYCESTFLEERAQSAEQTYHMTAKQAGKLAKKANANALVIGHFSARYRDITPFQLEASQAYEPTELAIEGKDYCVEE
jgi:ribonuclease Z